MKASEGFAHWNSARQGLYAALDRLSDEQLKFVPREGLWSLGTVAVHIATAEDGWLRLAAEPGLPGWPEARYRADELTTVPAIKQVLAEVHERTFAFLATIELEDLARMVELPWGETVTLGWIFWHILMHEITHCGEIFLMLGLMGMEAPDF
jgi:uncharacterized damage-inducible protein DinB